MIECGRRPLVRAPTGDQVRPTTSRCALGRRPLVRAPTGDRRTPLKSRVWHKSHKMANFLCWQLLTESSSDTHVVRTAKMANFDFLTLLMPFLDVSTCFSSKKATTKNPLFFRFYQLFILSPKSPSDTHVVRTAKMANFHFLTLLMPFLDVSTCF